MEEEKIIQICLFSDYSGSNLCRKVFLTDKGRILKYHLIKSKTNNLEYELIDVTPDISKVVKKIK